MFIEEGYMQKLPVEILTDNLRLEALGLYDTADLDLYVKENTDSLDEMTFTRSLSDALFEDKTLAYYALRSYYNFRQKKSAEYLIVENKAQKIIGYFEMRIRKDIGETYLWIHPDYRGHHYTKEVINGVEKAFFESGIKEIERSCSPHNPYFDKIAAYMPLAGYKKVIKNKLAAYPMWHKTREEWLKEQNAQLRKNTAEERIKCIQKNVGSIKCWQRNKQGQHS